jgi:hypothetical protein
MNFIEAMKELEKGRKIRMRCWDKEEYLISFEDTSVITFNNNTNRHREHPIGINALLNITGWEIYKEKPTKDLLEYKIIPLPTRLHTFEQALTALKNGKKIRRQSSISEYHLDKASSRILEIYDVEVHNGEAWWGESFSDEEVLANDWIILDN